MAAWAGNTVGRRLFQPVERELIRERIRSGIAAARARAKRLGRLPGQPQKSDRLTPKAMALIKQRRSYRVIGRAVGLSENTVADIVKRNRAGPARGSTQ